MKAGEKTMLEFVKKHRKKVAAAAGILVIAGVAFVYPEHAETVAKALLILIGAL